MTASAPASWNSRDTLRDTGRVAGEDAVGLARHPPPFELRGGAGLGIRSEGDRHVHDHFVVPLAVLMGLRPTPAC